MMGRSTRNCGTLNQVGGLALGLALVMALAMGTVAKGGEGDRASGQGAAGSAAPAQGAASCPEQARRETVEVVKQAMEAQLEAAGGSWEAWVEALEPFRTDMHRIRRTHGGAWPARDNFRFYGASWRLLQQDQITGGADDGGGGGGGGGGARARPADAIVALDRELRARGIHLILMPIPDKIAVYPDYISDKAPDPTDLDAPAPADPRIPPASPHVAVQVKRLMHELSSRDVEVIDLYTPFARWRRDRAERGGGGGDGDGGGDGGSGLELYYDRDGHWRNNAARLAAEKIAQRLERYDFVREAQRRPRRFDVTAYERTDGNKADAVERIVSTGGGEAYRDVDDAPVIVTGDSFSMYNMHLHGHLSAQVARRINMPVTFLCREGLGPEMPIELARRHRQGNYLEGRRVVVWTFAARHFQRTNWQMVPLQPPRTLDEDVTGLAARGRIAAISGRPRTDAAYPDFIMKLHVSELVDAEGVRIGEGEAVVRIAAMRQRELLAAAELQVGQRIVLELTSWNLAEPTHGQTAAGSLPDPTVELEQPHFWGELGE